MEVTMDNFDNNNNGAPMNVNVYVNTAPPAMQLKTNRDLLKVILLTIVTLGIYSIVFYSGVGEDLNAIASRYDGKKTMHYCLIFFLLTPITAGIAALVWYHKLSDRVGSELMRRGINYTFNAGTYWLWAVLGSLIIVGPFVYIAKMCAAMNELCRSYNANG